MQKGRCLKYKCKRGASKQEHKKGLFDMNCNSILTFIWPCVWISKNLPPHICNSVSYKTHHPIKKFHLLSVFWYFRICKACQKVPFPWYFMPSLFKGWTMNTADKSSMHIPFMAPKYKAMLNTPANQ